MRRRQLMGLAAITAASVLGASADDRGPTGVAPRHPALIATGSTGGVYHVYGDGMAATMNAAPRTGLGPVSTLQSTGSLENLGLLGSGTADFAFSSVDAVSAAYSDVKSARDATQLRAVARLYDDFMHLVVARELPVERVADLRGLRVSTGALGSGTALIAERILTASGLRVGTDVAVQRFGIQDSADALFARRVDAFFWSGGLPTVAISQLAAATPVRLVDLTAAAAALRLRYGNVYRTGTIPVEVYPVPAAVRTLAVPNLMMTTVTADVTLVRAFTEALFACAVPVSRTVPVAAQLNPRVAIFTEPVPLHDGARDYYRSTKLRS